VKRLRWTTLILQLSTILPCPVRESNEYSLSRYENHRGLASGIADTPLLEVESVGAVTRPVINRVQRPRSIRQWRGISFYLFLLIQRPNPLFRSSHKSEMYEAGS
jgi:hypothetical protein